MEQDCSEFERLRYNPLQIFKASKTPAGLYARQKWLDEADTAQWLDDFHETLHSLMSGQSDDGSWNPSPLESVRRLFGLHLTIRVKTEEIEKALDWLMGHTLKYKASNLTAPMEPVSPDAFRGLPFMPGQTRLSLICMTLFLATVFQKGNEPTVWRTIISFPCGFLKMQVPWIQGQTKATPCGHWSFTRTTPKTGQPPPLSIIWARSSIHQDAGLTPFLFSGPSTLWPICTSNRRTGNGTSRWQTFSAHRTAMGPGAAKTANGIPFLSSMP